MEYNNELLNFKYRLLLDCEKHGLELLEKGLAFDSAKRQQNYPPREELREVCAVGARYLHRGYYSPSPFRSVILENSRRGKLLKRPNKRSTLSHIYFFDNNDRLLIAESILPRGTKKTEYLVYEDNTIYGFAFDDWGTFVAASEETYLDGRLQSYLNLSCYVDRVEGRDLGITEILFDRYHYIGDELKDVESYRIKPLFEPPENERVLNYCVQGNRYRVKMQNGAINSFSRIHFDGTID